MSRTALQIVTAADGSPILLSDAKAHLRVSHGLEDALISSYVAAATDWAQQQTGRTFMQTVYDLSFDRFPKRGEAAWLRGDFRNDMYYIPVGTFDRVKDSVTRERGICLPGGKVTAVEQIQYIDTDGVQQTLSGPTSTVPGTDYTEDLTDDEWPQVFPQRESEWPAVQDGTVNAVTIRFTAGWDDVIDVPDAIKSAIRFKLTDLYQLRGAADAKGSAATRAAENLLFPYVIQEF